jgi:predicted ATPase
MLHLKEIRICSDEFPTRDYYPFNLGVLQQTETIPFSSPVTFLIGENGSGKFTSGAENNGLVVSSILMKKSCFST